jgi:hypothetical protein
MKCVILAMCVAVLLGLLTTPTILSDTQPARPESGMLNFGRLAGLKRPDLESELNKLSLERGEFSEEVISQLKSPSSEQARLAAMYLSGRYRLETAAPELAGQIDFHLNMTQEETKRLPLLTEWPAVTALIRIGDPAIHEMIRNIAGSDKPEVRRLSVNVLMSVLGTGLAKDAIREAISARAGANASDLKEIERLKSALSLVDSPATP